ncbi:MAG TPA: hypothetical protein VEH84_09890 [Alphaproteobacteria bacterium]|nr:hypothetical protein [Alphaproteobacteria bacterium]
MSDLEKPRKPEGRPASDAAADGVTNAAGGGAPAGAGAGGGGAAGRDDVSGTGPAGRGGFVNDTARAQAGSDFMTGEPDRDGEAEEDRKRG